LGVDQFAKFPARREISREFLRVAIGHAFFASLPAGDKNGTNRKIPSQQGISGNFPDVGAAKRQTQICGVTNSLCCLIKFRKPIFGATRK
jgi:hypothetical protein